MTWSRHHERLVHAYELLGHAHARAGLRGTPNLGGWLHRNFGVRLVAHLTPVQARTARRRLNAWRAGVEGRSEYRPRPRAEARARRRNALRRALVVPEMSIGKSAEFRRIWNETIRDHKGPIIPLPLPPMASLMLEHQRTTMAEITAKFRIPPLPTAPATAPGHTSTYQEVLNSLLFQTVGGVLRPELDA